MPAEHKDGGERAGLLSIAAKNRINEAFHGELTFLRDFLNFTFHPSAASKMDDSEVRPSPGLRH